MAEEYPLTGHPTIDSLLGLQRIADTIDDPNAKIDRVRKTIRIINAAELIDRKFFVTSSTALAQRPDAPPDTRLLFSNGLMFIAELESYGYLLDGNIPLDSLSMNFTAPEVIGIEPDEARAFRALRLQVPVLAIDSCMLAEAA